MSYSKLVTICCNAGTVSLNSSCAPGATKMEVSNHGKFVVLEVDGSNGLVVGMQSKQTEEVLSGELRLALGGVLIDKEKMIVEVWCVSPHCHEFYSDFSCSIDSRSRFVRIKGIKGEIIIVSEVACHINRSITMTTV